MFNYYSRIDLWLTQENLFVTKFAGQSWQIYLWLTKDDPCMITGPSNALHFHHVFVWPNL